MGRNKNKNRSGSQFPMKGRPLNININAVSGVSLQDLVGNKNVILHHTMSGGTSKDGEHINNLVTRAFGSYFK